MNNKLLVVGFSFMALLLTGCGENAKAESPLPESLIESLFNSSNIDTGSHSDKASKVIQSQFSFESELSTYTSTVAPQIDFNTNSVLFLSMGTQATGGHAISIDTSQIVITEKAVTLKVTYSYPGANCIVTQAITQPYAVLRIPTKKIILLQEEIKTIDC